MVRARGLTLRCAVASLYERVKQSGTDETAKRIQAMPITGVACFRVIPRLYLPATNDPG